MKKKLLTFALIPMVLSSCGTASLSVEQMKEYIKDVSSENLYPYYRVIGAIDFNNTFVEVDHEFTEDFREGEFIPYTRYNPGYYDPEYDMESEENTMNFYNGSRSYWARMPMRINKDNFYGTIINQKGKEVINTSCSYYLIFNYMKVWAGDQVKNADAGGQMIMEVKKDKDGNFDGFEFKGYNLHSKIIVDNYPEYPDPNNVEHWPHGITYEDNGPCPMYKNEIDASFNFLFSYNKDGWLEREYIASANYSFGDSSNTQFCAEANYTYKFHA